MKSIMHHTNTYANDLQVGLGTDDGVFQGFGMTLNTLNYFLEGHHCDLIPAKLSGEIGEDPDLIDELALNANDILTHGIVYADSDYYVQAYMILDLPISDRTKTQMNKEQARQNLQMGLTDFYGLPMNYDFQNAFKQFIQKYAGRCTIVDMA